MSYDPVNNCMMHVGVYFGTPQIALPQNLYEVSCFPFSSQMKWIRNYMQCIFIVIIIFNHSANFNHVFDTDFATFS
jgi:hypothetical protein